MNADDVLNPREIIFLLVFAFLVFVVPAILAWATYSENNRFDLRSLWTHNDRIDKFAVIILLTWWVHTSAIILDVLLRTATTQDMAAYTAWAIPIIAKMFAPAQPPLEEKKP